MVRRILSKHGYPPDLPGRRRSWCWSRRSCFARFVGDLVGCPWRRPNEAGSGWWQNDLPTAARSASAGRAFFVSGRWPGGDGDRVRLVDMRVSAALDDAAKANLRKGGEEKKPLLNSAKAVDTTTEVAKASGERSQPFAEFSKRLAHPRARGRAGKG